MGDPARFRLLADLVATRFPDRKARVADVAAGKGGLKAALYLAGYRRVTCWDVRRRLAKPRPGQRYQLFDWRLAPRDYDLVVALHPDGATDHAILYAARHRVPVVVCPCCPRPSAAPYAGRKHGWVAHLERLARDGGLWVERVALPMTGDNVVLVGVP